MIILLWLLAGLSFGQTENVSSQIEQSINRTIDTVEKIVNSDPSLPRLSRHDILNILQNITTGNPEFAKIEKMTRDAYQRALTVVFPHSTNDAQNDVKELYTKSPFVHMIPDSIEADAIVEVGRTEEIIFPPNPKDPSPFSENLDKSEAAPSTISTTISSIKVECRTVRDESRRNHRPSYSEPQRNFSFPNNINDIMKNDAEPEKFTFNLSNLNDITRSTQEYIASTNWPIYKDGSDTKPSDSNIEKVAIVYSTNVTPKSNIKNDKTTSSTNYPVMYNSGLDVLKSDKTQYKINNQKLSKLGKEVEKYIFLPTMPSFPGNINNYFEIPKKLTGSYSDNEESERPAPVYVTPVSTSEKTMKIGQETNLNNNIPTAAGGFSIATKIETSVKPIDILESMGLKPHLGESNSDHKNDIKITKNMIDSNYEESSSSSSRFNLPLNLADFTKSPNDNKAEPTIVTAFGSTIPIDNLKNIYDNKHIIAKNINSKYNDPVGLTSFNVDFPSIAKQNTFENPELNFKKGIENLSPDMHLLFQRFGLQSSLKDMLLEKIKTTTSTTMKPTTTSSYLDSFTSFKRLPSSSIENKEMRDFLMKFGLGNLDMRSQKSMQSRNYVTERPKPKGSSFDMRKALDNIGLLALVPRSDEVTIQPKLKPSSSQIHVFKPHEIASSSEEQRQKIYKLLNTVKMVQEGKVQNVQEVVADLVQTSKSLKSGPDPVNLEEILRIYKEEMKNERKRQRQAIFEETDDILSTAATSDYTSTETISSETPLKENIESSTEIISTTQKGSFFDTFNFNIPLLNGTDSDAKSSVQPDNFAALEESFGGTTAEPDPVLPTRPRTGLYFLVDWNTFLEVGEDGKDKVNLRFQPKIGDKTRFIPVKIP